LLVSIFLAAGGRAPDALAQGDFPEVALPQNLTDDLAYLLAFNDPSRQQPAPFEPERVADILDFITGPKEPECIYTAAAELGEPSAYAEFDLDTDMKRLIRVAYSPDIPGMATAPASVRLHYWTRVNGNGGKLPRLWERFDNLDQPVVVSGTAYEQITPDPFSGTYYDYDLDRTLVLFQHRGRRVLISLSKQRDVSEVGKKGVTLGADEEWNYLYTGDAGVPKFGLGWVRAYMYDSYSVMVYIETDPAAPRTRLGIFKWVRAGWQDINMVRSYHIYRGMNRFAKGFTEVLHSPSLADTSAITAEVTRIRQLSQDELKSAPRRYLDRLKKQYRHSDAFAENDTASLFEDDRYLNQLNREQMEAILIIEYLKNAAGSS
jgi:hypothetical protein